MIKLKLKDVNWRKITGIFLLITLIASIVYTIVMIFISPSGTSNPEAHDLVKSDYTLMLIQCVLGLVVMLIPSGIERKWSISIPNYMYVLYFVFLYCAVYLGEVHSFYYVIPYWDNILHAFSGAMLGASGYAIVIILNNAKEVNLQLSPFFVAMFAFCFALTIGTIWEIYEYLVDCMFGLNMQKYMLQDGTFLAGQKALQDTMEDIMVDAVSALAVTTFGYFTHLLEHLRGIKKNNNVPL